MENKKDFTEAMQNLEKLYKGIPDDSVDLTFKYLTAAPQNDRPPSGAAEEKAKKSTMELIKEENPTDISQKGCSSVSDQRSIGDKSSRRALCDIQREVQGGSKGCGKGFVVSPEPAMATPLSPFEGREKMQRKGIPHTNTCALCNSYIRFFRHRCLVCGRAYCKNCVAMGMGEMTEGRKCIECLGRRFSERYIDKAGKSPSCWYGYPNEVRRQELMWAEKGPTSKSAEERGFNESAPRNYMTQYSNPLGTPLGTPHRQPPAKDRPANYIITASASFSSAHGFPLGRESKQKQSFRSTVV